MYLGCIGAPNTHCGNTDGAIPATTITVTPKIAEKPYIICDGGRYKLMVPNYETNKVGHTNGWQNAVEVDFSQVYVAHESDSAATINAKLSQGLHIVIQPGNYRLSESLKVTHSNQVILGIGMTTLISSGGQPIIEVGNVDGVRIAGLLLQAGPIKSETLLKVGTKGYAGSAATPVVLNDIFARVGGPTTAEEETDVMMEVNSGHTIIDHTWLWRADHDISGIVKNERHKVKNALIVNGDNVNAYGLFGEHVLEDIVLWNGNNGNSYFLQSEIAYDTSQDHYANRGFAGYVVANNVTSHNAYGLGVYTFFRDNKVVLPSAIKAPMKSGIRFTNSVGVFLNGNGGMQHVVNNAGGSVHQGVVDAYLCTFVGEETPTTFLQ